MGIRYIEFNVSKQKYALPINSVKEVISTNQKITNIPNTPSYYLGIVNLRGMVIPIIDLKNKMKLKDEKISEEEAFIILETNGKMVGIKVDSVNKVFVANEEDLTDPPTIETDPNNQFVERLYKTEENITIIMSIKKMFSLMEEKQTNLKAA